MHTFEVESAGVRLAVSRGGDTSGPTVVLLHGYPDTRAVWSAVADHLCDRFDVVAADMRGAGESTTPADTSGYRMRRLIDDIASLIDELPAPVHLVGHDWGSVQGWGAVLRESTDARLTGQIASFTSISGPPLALFTRFLGTELRAGRLNRAARQLAHSWYIGAFQIPRIPEFALARFGGRIQTTLGRERGQQSGESWAPTFTQDAIHGLNLYRANAAREALRPRERALERGNTRSGNRTSVPVQLVVPLHDSFISPAMFDRIGDFAESVDRTDIATGHWAQLSRPELVAGLIERHVNRHVI